MVYHCRQSSILEEQVEGLFGGYVGNKQVAPSLSSVRSSLDLSRRVSPYERIKQSILAGELHPGEPLVEATLAQWCAVSRTPIREALMRLEQDGLIRRGNRGFVVRESSPEEILDLYEMRIVLESTAARVAAERRTVQDILLLRSSHGRVARYLDDPTAMAKSNQSFHRSIWRASHNDSLVDLLERLNLHLGRYPATTLAFPGRPGSAYKEHEHLIEAIEARDGDAAAEAARQHFTAARDIRLRLWSMEEQ